MNVDDLVRRLSISGVSCRVRRDEVVVEVCPYCGNDRWNMEINLTKGVASCWACGEPRPGRADTVIALLTGEAVRVPVRHGETTGPPATVRPEIVNVASPLENVPSALRYLQRRGVDSLTARRYGIGICLIDGHMLEGRIVVPALDYFTARPVGWIGRSYTGRKPKYLSTVASPVPVTGWRALPTAACVIVEGHLDGIAVREAGYSAAVLGGVKGPGLEEWVARLDDRHRIVIMFDGTAVTEASSAYYRAVAVRGGDSGSVARVFLPPGADPASVGREEIRRLVQ